MIANSMSFDIYEDWVKARLREAIAVYLF